MCRWLDEKGLALIVAVVIMLVFAVMAVVMASLVSNDSDISLYQFRSGEAFYIAMAGQQYTMMQTYPPARVNPQVNVGSGGFTVDPPAALSAAITNTTNPIPVVCYDKAVAVNCNTVFPATGRILIESELVDYTGVTANSFTGVTRGVGRSLAASHVANQGVYHATPLTAGVTSAVGTIPVTNTSGFVIPGTIKIDQEFLYCTGTAGGFSGCTRGTQGSTAVAHNSGATAIQVTVQVTGTVSTGIVGNAQRILQAQTGVYRDGWVMGSTVTLIRWNGINWDTVSAPGGVTQNLNSVSMLDTNNDGTADDGWAVGDRRGCANPGLTILRWNGTNWSCPGGLPVVDQNLNSIYMVSPTAGWSVGNRRGCINPGPTILRWNGINWACAPNLPASADRDLLSLSMISATDGWTVGQKVGTRPTMLRWNQLCPGGTGAANQWNDCTSDAPTTNQDLNGVFMLSVIDGWAVGNRVGGGAVTMVRWNRACPTAPSSPNQWNDCTIDTPAGGQPLASVSLVDTNGDGIGDDGWAVGNVSGGRPTMFRWNIPCGGGAPTNRWQNCAATAPPIAQALNFVYMLSATDGWAVGNGGFILHWDGASWSQYTSPTANNLNEVFLIQPKNFFRLADWQEVY